MYAVLPFIFTENMLSDWAVSKSFSTKLLGRGWTVRISSVARNALGKNCCISLLATLTLDKVVRKNVFQGVCFYGSYYSPWFIFIFIYRCCSGLC